MSRPLLDVRGLGVSFERSGWPRPSYLRAAHRVTFTVHPGEVVALVGESGSGKSTIGRVIAGLQPAVAGSVLLDGTELPIEGTAGLPAHLRGRVQMVFQDPYGSLNPVHTVFHHISRPLLLHKRAQPDELRQRVSALLEQVGLGPAEDFIDRKPQALSGGQRQRVAIARALAPRPDLLVADEPTASLDVSVRMSVLTMFRKLQKRRQLGVLFITHDLASARWMADRIVVLYAGQVMEQGPAREVLTRPRHPYTQLLVAAGSHRPEPLPGKPGLPPVVDPPPGCPFAERCPRVTPGCIDEEATVYVAPDTSPAGAWRVRCHHPDSHLRPPAEG